MFIDSHCHLNFRDFDADLASVVTSAKKAGVGAVVTVGVDTRSSGRAVALSRAYPGFVFATSGIHPYEAQTIQDAGILKGLSRAVVAVGECGLDYHLYKGFEAVSKKDNQKRLFSSQLELAAAHNLPVIIHCREAFDDLFSVLDARPALPRGVLHCFSGGLADLRRVTERGLFVGIDGNVTYSKLLKAVVPQIPMDRLLIETDAPYLTPVPHRGQRNEPKYVRLVAREIASLKGITPEEVEAATERNARALFPFDRVPAIVK